MPRPARSTREAPRWPAIVLRTPKGWTGPRVVDGVQVEGTFHSHQVPLSEVRENAEHLAMLERWLRSYRPDELFDGDGRPVAGLDALRPVGDLRMSATPVANGGLLRALELPDDRVVRTRRRPRRAGHDRPGDVDVRRLARRAHAGEPDDVRLFGPDEVLSNRLGAVFDVTSRAWSARLHPLDEHLSRSGRVIEALSETLMQGLLEGYLLTGRHGLITSYEAFIHIVDSMFNQHAKWLESAKEVPWRGDVRLAQLRALVARVAAGPQRLLAPGPGLPQRRGQQAGRDRARVPAARREHACSRSCGTCSTRRTA